MHRLVVLISGTGSNLQSIIDSCNQGKINAHVVSVISHHVNAYGLKRATAEGIETRLINSKDFSNREEFDSALITVIDSYRPSAIVLAGYMRILSPFFVSRYYGRILNIHPSLLPRYPGLNTHRKALINGDFEHGTSVHFVTNKLDSGPVILQGKVPVLAGDDESMLAQRVKIVEHAIYPLTINWLLTGRLKLRNEIAWLDGKPLPLTGYDEYQKISNYCLEY